MMAAHIMKLTISVVVDVHTSVVPFWSVSSKISVSLFSKACFKLVTSFSLQESHNQ